MLKKIILRFTSVTHSSLVAAGFDTDHLYYTVANLHIYVSNKKFYFRTRERKQKRLRNMLQVSNLIYGKTPYFSLS